MGRYVFALDATLIGDFEIYIDLYGQLIPWSSHAGMINDTIRGF